MEKRRERMEVTLCGGKPWGFSIKGGTESNKSIIVSKLENRGKGEASGLRVGDIIISVNHVVLGGIRREAVELIRRAGDRLMLEVERVFPPHMINPPSQSRSSHFENVNPGSRMPLVSRFQDEEILELQNNTNNMNTSYNNNQQRSREYINQNQNDQRPRGYIFSEKSNRLPTSPHQHYEKDTQNKTAFAERIEIDHHQNKSGNASPSPQKLAEQERRGIASRRSVGPISSMTNSNERLVNDEPVPPPRQVATRRRQQQQNKNPERPRSWHASKHPDVEQELRSYIEKSTSQKMTKRKSKGWLETEDLKSTLEGDSTESLTGREQRFQKENKASQEPANKFRGSCPDTMNYEELVNYRSEPVSLSRSSLDNSNKSINNRTDRESISSESSCSMRIEGSLGNKFRSSGRYGEIWKLPQNQEHRRARSFDALSEEPANHNSMNSTDVKRSSLRKSTGSTGSESSPHIHQNSASKQTSPSKSKPSTYNFEQQSGKEQFRVTQHFNLDKGELSISDTSSSSMEQAPTGNTPKQVTTPGEIKFSYQSDSMVVKLLRNPTTANPKAGDFSIIQTKRPKSASSKIQPHLSRTSLSSLDDFNNAEDKNNEESNAIMPNNDEYKKNIQGMSKKVLRVTSFTRKDLELSPPYQSSLQPVKQEFGFPALYVQKSFLSNNGSAPVRSKSTSSLLEKPVMSTVAIPITPDKTQYCESVSASQSRPYDSPRMARQSNTKKIDDSDSWWIKHTKESRSNSLKKGSVPRYEDTQQQDRDSMKQRHGSTSPHFARSPPKDRISQPSFGDKYGKSADIIKTSPISHDITKSQTPSTEIILRDTETKVRVEEDKISSKISARRTSPASRESAKSRKLSESRSAQINKPLSSNLPIKDPIYNKSSAQKVGITKTEVPKSNKLFTSKGIIPSYSNDNIPPTSKNLEKNFKRSNFDTPQPFHDTSKAKSINETATAKLKPPSSRNYGSPIHRVSPPSPKASHSREGSGESSRTGSISPKATTKSTVPLAKTTLLQMETSPSQVEEPKIELDEASKIKVSEPCSTFSVQNEKPVLPDPKQFYDETVPSESSSNAPKSPLSPIRDDVFSAQVCRPRLSDSLTMLPIDREDSTTAVKVLLAKNEMLPTQKEVDDEMQNVTETNANLPKDTDRVDEVPVFEETCQPTTQQSILPVKQSMTTKTKPTTTTNVTTVSTTDSSLRNTILSTPALTNFSNFFMSPTSTLPASSTYYQTSASKGKIINLIQEKVEGGEFIVSESDETEDDMNNKKVKLLTSFTNHLSVLQKNKDLIKMDIEENEKLGKVVRQNAEQLCTPREHEKFKTFVEEVDKIFNLLLSIGGRLARVENALATLDPEASAEEKNGLLEKKRKLTLQHEEAQLLKENVDRRQKLVSEILYSHMSEEQYTDFEHYIRMKTLFISEQRDLDDKMKLGEEQLRELYDSLPESLQESLPLALQYQAYAPPATNEQSTDLNKPS
uniref:protein Shroom2-like n=1 Tax=Styela clava TaxID=7725 RepID=UPI00193A2142|nr:protein Shroom2-like [Styela clava]